MQKIYEWVRKHVKEGNKATVDDAEVYSLAIHYWQEDDPKYIPELFDDSPLIYGDISKQFRATNNSNITGNNKETLEKRKTRKISKKMLTILFDRD